MAVIGGQLAHPAPLQNSYCNGLVQPSLIMNHHVDCQEDIHPILATNISEYIWQQSKVKLMLIREYLENIYSVSDEIYDIAKKRTEKILKTHLTFF